MILEKNAHTSAYYAVLKPYMENKREEYTRRFNCCKIIKDFVDMCISVMDYSIGVNSSYRGELTISQLEKLDGLLPMIKQAISLSSFIFCESPKKVIDSIHEKIKDKYKENRNFLHDVADFINSILGRNGNADLIDKIEISHISFDCRSIIDSLYLLIDTMDQYVCGFQEALPAKAVEKQLDEDALKVLHRILSSLHVNRTEIPEKLAAQTEEIEDLLKDYGIEVIWISEEREAEGEYFIMQNLRDIEHKTLIKPCLVKNGMVLIKGIIAIPRKEESE